MWNKRLGIAFAVALGVALTAGPASGQISSKRELISGGPVPIDVINVDAFTNTDPGFINEIMNIEVARIDPLAVGSNPGIVLRGLGIEGPPSDARFLSSGEALGLYDDPSTAAGLAHGIVSFNLDRMPEAEREALGVFALSGEGTPPDRDMLLDAQPYVLEALGGLEGIEPVEAYEAMRGQVEEIPREFGLAWGDTELEPGFFTHETLGTAAPPGQPIDSLAEGTVIVITELAQPFGTFGLSEFLLSFAPPGPTQVGQLLFPGGPVYDTDVFPNDAFIGSTGNAVLRHDGVTETIETQLFDQNFWFPTVPVVPMAAEENIVIAHVPTGLFVESGGFRATSFVSNDGTYTAGQVGTSSHVPISATLPAIEAPQARIADDSPTIDTELVASALNGYLIEIDAIEAPGTDAAPSQPAPDPVQGAGDETTQDRVEESSNGSEEGQEDQGGDGDGGSRFGWILIAAGVPAAMVGAWLWFTGQSGAAPAAAAGPCDELRRRMEAAKAACDAATTAAADAASACDDAKKTHGSLKGALGKVRRSWPPAFEEGDGAWVEDAHGNRVTSRDLHARRQALGPIWTEYQRGNLTAQEVEAYWEQADTPEFREGLRERTAQAQRDAAALEEKLEKAESAAETACAKVAPAQKAASEACAAYDEARAAYDECVAQAVIDEADAAADAAVAAAKEVVTSSAAGAVADTGAAAAMEVAATPPPTRYIGPGDFTLDTSSLSGDEKERAERLSTIFTTHRGTGDRAAVAEDLYEFQNWHIETFGEPWFIWTTSATAAAPTATAASIDTFMQTRELTCYEFVHFCSYIASDQTVRQKTEEDDDGNVTFLDDYTIKWDFPDDVTHQPSGYDADTAERGQVVTGVSRIDSWNNKEGYFHTAIYVGDGKVIGLGGDGLELEDTIGIYDVCFNRFAFGEVYIGDYEYSVFRQAPGTSGP